MAFTSINLAEIPPPQLVEELSAETIIAERIADFKSINTDYDAIVESDPAYKLQESGAYRELKIRARINETAKRTMLAHSKGTDLDNFSANFNVERLIISEATEHAPAVYESDERLRIRTQLAMEGLSTAGSIGAYTYHALTASALVKDVAITSPAGGVVDIVILSTESDGTPTQDLIDTVTNACSADDKRPLTDTVMGIAANVMHYSVNARLVMYAGPDREVVFAAAQASADKYVAEHHKLGHDITMSGLSAALHQPGVQNVIFDAPLETLEFDDYHCGYCDGVTIIDGGIAE